MGDMALTCDPLVHCHRFLGVPIFVSFLQVHNNAPKTNVNYYPAEERELNPPPRRMASEQYMDAMRRTHHDGTQIRTQAEVPQPGAARHNMWSQVLDAGRNPQPEEPQGNTFVQLNTAEKLTKAFTPHGLLSAGLQDKQDRSAKRQEELARETGASLINVPNKPPPPQMGLLGAITAHERDRKREGGVGAALTEREREKRLAEDRQRRFDDHQRQQLDQMQQGGSMYGQFPGYNMNPMMAPGMAPMMTGGGMAPMMTGQMGYPGMMPGFNPHMFAAQQAAQAYQQAMMAFSVAGSQMGGEGSGMPQQQPSVAGGGMGGMGGMGFDPRMSMMGMPMMTPQPMGPMGMQATGTGMSTFDPRFSPGLNNSPSVNDLTRPNPGFASKGKDSSRGSSPARGGSPMARPASSSRPATPKT
jgi:CCR4-NOT transcriptional complex subunit CAF120